MKPPAKKDLDPLEKALLQQQQNEQTDLEQQFTAAKMATNLDQFHQRLHMATPTRVVPLRYFLRTVA